MALPIWGWFIIAVICVAALYLLSITVVCAIEQHRWNVRIRNNIMRDAMQQQPEPTDDINDIDWAGWRKILVGRAEKRLKYRILHLLRRL
jgi:hypothetical protein